MAVLAYSVAFQGMDAREVEVQCHLAPGLPAFSLVGLPDKAVAESKERVRAALNAIGLALPPKRITINLAPADALRVFKFTSHPVPRGWHGINVPPGKGTAVVIHK